jgi:NAD-dependent deacetylase
MPRAKEHIVILSGAGISAESSVSTFRDAGGLWEGHDILEVASPQGWERDPELVLDFYNKRRAQLLTVDPNPAHRALVELEERYEVTVVTQNVDDLHERAGSGRILHLHGELLKARSTKNPRLIYPWTRDLRLGDRCEEGSQLRPHVVWFGETVPMLEVAAQAVSRADCVLIIGTSMQVYPAAGLVGFAPPHTPVHYIDPRPHINYELRRAFELEVIEEKASAGVRQVVESLMEED